GKQLPCDSASRELAMVGFNRKGGIDNTNVRITSRNFIMRSLLRLLVRLLHTDALLAFRPPSNKCRSHTIRIASLSQISNANSGTDVCQESYEQFFSVRLLA